MQCPGGLKDMFMKALRFVVCSAVALVAAAAVFGNTLNFEGITASYNGKGTMTLGERIADYTYTLNISNAATETATGSLTITPRFRDARTQVAIDSINCDGNLTTVRATFAPGRTAPSFIRNIRVKGSLGQLTVEGGDLGAPDGQDGKIVVGGSIGSITINAKKFSYQIPGSPATFTEWWGGNLWADIWVGSNIQKIVSKGGDLYYDPNGGILGTITLGGNFDKLSVQGTIIKTNSKDATSEIYRGGNINANILGSPLSVIKAINCQGGAITDGRIQCLQLVKLTTTGQKPTDPFYIPLSSQGVFKTYVVAADVGGDGAKSDLQTLTVKNGSIRDSLFAIKGSVNGVTVSGTGTATNQTCLISNVIMRAGFFGDLSESNLTPSIYPNWLSTNVYAGAHVIIPFAITGQTNEELTVRLHYRDRALAAVISNDYGQYFVGTNRWHTTETAATGYFVWLTYTNNVGMSSNITIRVRDNGTPNKYADFTIAIGVVTNVNPVVLLIDPPDNPRTNAVGLSTVVWSLNVQDPLSQGPIAYQASGMSTFELGITVTNLSSQSAYAYTTKILLPGIYTDIVFTANNGVFSDRKVITLVLTGVLAKASEPAGEWTPPLEPMSPAASAGDTTKSPEKWEGSFDGDIGKVSTVGNMYNSMFIASASDNPPNAWSNAYFFSQLKSLKIQGVASNNTFISVKKVAISKPAAFDYTNNFLWVNGLRIMTKDQQ